MKIEKQLQEINDDIKYIERRVELLEQIMFKQQKIIELLARRKRK